MAGIDTAATHVRKLRQDGNRAAAITRIQNRASFFDLKLFEYLVDNVMETPLDSGRHSLALPGCTLCRSVANTQAYDGDE